MRILLIGSCLLLTIAPTASGIWSGPRLDGWTATNKDDFCSLAHPVGSAASNVLFTFALIPNNDGNPQGITFHVTPMQCELAWPVHIRLGPKPNAKSFTVNDRSSTPRSLPTAEAKQLLSHLKTGGELHIEYALNDGVLRQAILGQHKFAQSVAMFEACTTMLPNYAMQQSALVVTPLAGTASGSYRFRSASGAPTVRRR